MKKIVIGYYLSVEETEEEKRTKEFLEKTVTSFFSAFLSKGIELEVKYRSPKDLDGRTFPSGSVTVFFPDGNYPDEKDMAEITGADDAFHEKGVSALESLFPRILLSSALEIDTDSCNPSG